MKHCVVIDDSRVIRKIACTILESMDYETREAEDGPAALELCRSSMPDLVLVDLQMPGMSSAEFSRALRRLARGEQPFVLLCTTENDIPRIAEALHAGADQYIFKPFDKQSLAERLAPGTN
jgi:two-component system chemotaxis response regulator CheY